MSDDDYDRLYAIKEKRGRNELNGNEFARNLLEEYLYQLHPERVPREPENDEGFDDN